MQPLPLLDDRPIPGGTGFQPVIHQEHRLEAGATRNASAPGAEPIPGGTGFQPVIHPDHRLEAGATRNASAPGAEPIPGGTGFQPVIHPDHRLEAGATRNDPAAARRGGRLPPWLKRELPRGNGAAFTQNLLADLRLETVCENARCPNRTECWSRRTATFMILGNVCTRPCSFCSVPKGEPLHVESDEPDRVAEAAARLGLKHVVITSVTRDDLPDGGAAHFAACIRAVRQRLPGAAVEVLTPDFLGIAEAIDVVIAARPEVFNHNIETVPRLYRVARGRADYRRSLDLLDRVKKTDAAIATKAGLMLGLGETIDELFDVLADLRAIRCDVLTLGQYLAPTLKQSIPVARFVPPAEFDELARVARSMGFRQVAAGPFVRSSYHAEEMAAS